jgi:GWxTD domain-containing protein
MVLIELIRKAILGSSILFLVSGSLHSQVEALKPKESGFPQFYLDALNFASNVGGTSRLDVYVQVPYGELLFAKAGEQFVASYEVTADVLDSAGVVKLEKVWNETVGSGNFSETTSSKEYSLTQRNFAIEPGIYKLVVQVRDNESRKTLKVSRPVVIRDYSLGKLAISDIMLVGRLTVQGEKRTVVPNVSGNVGNLPDSLYVFFEVYNRTGLDTLKFTYKILAHNDAEVLSGAMSQLVTAGRNPVFIKINKTNLTFGSYQLVIVATPVWYIDVTEENRDQGLLALVTRPFASRWANVPITSGDINAAIEQLQYIATDSQIDSMKAGKSDVEKQQKFLQFWRDRTNPSLEEYFGRVEYANQHFKAHREGWRTDMGMVFIMFGAPSNVDRHPFDIDSKPYEVWDYYDINRRFIFWDETGFGDYRLDPRTPIWDRWGGR